MIFYYAKNNKERKTRIKDTLEKNVMLQKTFHSMRNYSSFLRKVI